MVSNCSYSSFSVLQPCQIHRCSFLRKVKSISTIEAVPWVSPCLKSVLNIHKAQPSLQIGLCPRIPSLKGAGHQAILMGDVSHFPPQYFGGQKALHSLFLPAFCPLPHQTPTVMNKRGRLRELDLQVGRCLHPEAPLNSGVHKCPRARSREGKAGTSSIDTRSSRQREKKTLTRGAPACSIFTHLCRRH